MNDINSFIDKNKERYVGQLKRLVQKPSISSQGIGLEETAVLVKEIMNECDIPCELYPVPNGPPVVFSYVMSGRESKTLLNYAHYDVQPPEPLELWTYPPFGAEIHDGIMYGRGVTDNKSGLLAFVQALEAFMKVRGKPPVNIKLVFEGEEEIGSVHFEEWVKNNRNKLEADATFGLDGGTNKITGIPEIILGIKSILYVELRVKGLDREIHSGLPNAVPNVAWRLVKVLNELVDGHRRVLVPGWYDELEPVTGEDRKFMEQIVSRFDKDQIAKQLKIDGLPENFSPVDLMLEAYFGGTCNICGLRSGYTGQGLKTVMPTDAVAKIDFRLPPALKPKDQLAKLKTYLLDRGFDDVEVHCEVIMAPPWRFSPREEIAQAVIRAAENVFGELPLVFGLSAQGMILRNLPTMKAAFSGFGPPEPNLHAPDENMPVECYLRGVKYAAAVMEEYGYFPV